MEPWLKSNTLLDFFQDTRFCQMFHREGEIERTRQFGNEELRGDVGNCPSSATDVFRYRGRCGLPSGEPGSVKKSRETHPEDQTIPNVQLCVD